MAPLSLEFNKLSKIDWAQIILTLLYLVVSPFYIALFNGYDIFYEHNLFFAVLWTSFILLIFSVRFIKNTPHWVSLLIWLIPVTYLISMVNAASPHLATNMLYLNLMYSALFVYSAHAAAKKSISTLLQYGITIVGYIIVIYGFINLFGNTYYRDAVMIDIQGIRLTSVFQYANSYAGFLVAILLVCIFFLVFSYKRYFIFLHAFMIVPMILSLLLTLSRGGLVVLPIILLFVLPFIPIIRQIFVCIYIAIGFISAYLISDKITDWGIQIANQVLPTVTPDWKADTLSPFSSLSLSSWCLFLGTSIVIALIVYLIQAMIFPLIEIKLQRLNKIKYSTLILPTLFVVMGIIGIYLLFGNAGFTSILPESLKTRVEGINFNENSVLERFTFYKDSIKLLRDYPIFGAGGGGWASLFEYYQNNPYTSRQAHSFFMQSLVETGIVGFTVLLLVLFCVFFIYIKNYIKSNPTERISHFGFYIIAVSLLFHSIIDFDISYAYLASIIFICLGGMLSSVGKSVALKDVKLSPVKFIYPAFTGIIAVMLCYMMILNLKVNSKYQDSIERITAGEVLQNAIIPINQALDMQPYHPDLNLKKIDWFTSAYEQTKNDIFSKEVIRLIDTMKKHEPYNRFFIERDYIISIKMEDKERALSAALEGVEKLQWDIEMYDRAISLLFELGDNARLDNDTKLQNQYWDKLLELYELVNRKSDQLKLLPVGQDQGRPFNITPDMNLVAGEVHFIRGDFNAAANILKLSLPEVLENETSVNLVRWYLASLMKMNRSDEILLKKLLDADPRQKDYLEGIVNYDFSPNK